MADECSCSSQTHAEHIIDDGNYTEPVNVAARVQGFVTAAQAIAQDIDCNDIAITMGGKPLPSTSVVNALSEPCDSM